MPQRIATTSISALRDCREDFFIEIVPFLNRIEGKEKVRAHLKRLSEAFPDNAAVREAIAVGDDVVISLWHLRGTMRARFLGMEATGREIDVLMVPPSQGQKEETALARWNSRGR